MKNKRRKGMTLLEIIISIAIYAVLAALLTEIMTTVNAMMRSTDQLNNRLAFEARYADNLRTSTEDGVAFSMVEENVGGTVLPGVKVSIQYGITRGAVTEANPTGITDVANVLDSKGGQPIRASEWTASYPKDDEQTDKMLYHRDTNYRFMTFGFRTGGKPNGPFMINLNIKADEEEIAKITKIEVKTLNSLTLDGSTRKSYVIADETGADLPLSSITPGGTIQIPVANLAPASGGTSMQQVQILINEKFTFQYQAQNEQSRLASDAKLDFYQSLEMFRPGAAVSNETLYYNQCTIDYLGNKKFGFPNSEATT